MVDYVLFAIWCIASGIGAWFMGSRTADFLIRWVGENRVALKGKSNEPEPKLWSNGSFVAIATSAEEAMRAVTEKTGKAADELEDAVGLWYEVDTELVVTLTTVAKARALVHIYRDLGLVSATSDGLRVVAPLD